MSSFRELMDKDISGFQEEYPWIIWILDNVALVHVGFFAAGFVIWMIPQFRRGVLNYLFDAVCFVLFLFSSFVLLFLLENFSADTWEHANENFYILISFTTLGVAPLITLTSFLLTGRLFARYFRRLFLK